MIVKAVLLELLRFRIVATDSGRPRLQVRSGRLTGNDTWLQAEGVGEYDSFIDELGRYLTKERAGFKACLVITEKESPPD